MPAGISRAGGLLAAALFFWRVPSSACLRLVEDEAPQRGLFPLSLQELREEAWGAVGAYVHESNHGGSSKIPPPNIFAKLWERNLQKEEGASDFPSDVKLAVGIFLTEKYTRHDEVTKVIKRTWMSQKGVCLLKDGQKPGCGVYVAFILGRSSSSSHDQDELVLNVTENMNKGKTFDFFRHVAKAYPWATHIGKMDLDTFPYLHRLTESLHDHLASGKCQNHYVGDPMNYTKCGYWPWCPPKNCSVPIDEDFLKFKHGMKNCWSYMQGGMYVLSTAMVRDLTKPGSMWSQQRKGFEDLRTGKAVGWFAKYYHKCVATWNPLAWDHLGTAYDRTFPNHTVVPLKYSDWESIPTVFELRKKAEKESN